MTSTNMSISNAAFTASPKDPRGIPIEDSFPGAEMPAFLKGALVYDTPRGRIIARREPNDHDSHGERKDSGSARSEATDNRVADIRPPEPDRPEPAAKPQTPTPEGQDNPMRPFRRPRDPDRDDFER
jgi:hypothetical protein